MQLVFFFSKRYLVFALVIIFVSFDAAAKPLKEYNSGDVFLGGLPPRLNKLDVVGRIKKDGLYYYKLKAVVRRASGDEDGFATVLKARTWRDAYLTVAGASPNLQSNLKLFLPKLVGSRTKFPTLRLKYDYRLFFPDKGTNNKKSRKAKGRKMFVEPIEFGFRPGPFDFRIYSCVKLAEHPISKVVDIVSVMSFVASAPSLLTPFGVARAAFLSAVKKKLTCTSVEYKLNLKAKVPLLLGLVPSEAKKELEANNLSVKFIKTGCSSVKARVTKQSPAPGTYLSAGQPVTVTYCVKGGSDDNPGSGGSYVVYIQPDKLTCCTEANGKYTYQFFWGVEGKLPSNAIPLSAGFKTYDLLQTWVCNRPVYYHYWARNWAYFGSYKVSMLPCEINQ